MTDEFTLFHDALERPLEQRDEFLRDAAANHPQLAERVRELLEAHDAAENAPDTVVPAGSLEERLIGQHIAGYRIQSLLGSGGMGLVFLAEQDHPRREVALKIVRPGIATNTLLRRLEHEAELLGRLRHPGIAQVYEAGTADVGLGPQPFFAMERIQGETLIRFCDRHRLSVPARLALVADLCDAVHHAHLHGVVHRDLKPDNVLVETDGRPKVLDFGIARPLDDSLKGTEWRTRSGQVLGTLPYLSPELLTGDPTRVGPSCDVYALGVILHELLAGHLPLNVAGVPLARAIEIIREQVPESLGEQRRELKGDVETIVGKALEKDPARRYPSAAELGHDLRRHLQHEPILARPPSTLYQLRKFARRHRALVGGVTVAFVALGTGASVAVWKAMVASEATRKVQTQLGRARAAEQLAEERRVAADQARTEAQVQADTARAVNEFLNSDLLQSILPTREGRSVTVHEVVMAACDSVGARFHDKPRVEAAVRATLGEVLFHLGEPADARAMLMEAIRLLDAERGRDNADSHQARKTLAIVHRELGEFQAAEEIWRELITGYEVRGDHGDRILAEHDLTQVWLTQGRHDEAEQVLSRLVDECSAHVPDEEALRSLVAATYGSCLFKLGRITESLPFLRQRVEDLVEQEGMRHPSTLAARQNLAVVLANLQRFREAEQQYQAILEVSRELHGDGSLDLAESLAAYATLLLRDRRYDEAEGLFLEALEVQRDELGEENWRSVHTLNNLLQVYKRSGRTEDGLSLVEEYLDFLPDPDELEPHWALAVCLNTYGQLLIEMEEWTEAEEVLRAADTVFERSEGWLPAMRADNARNLATVCRKLGRHQDAADFESKANTWR